MGKLIIHYDNGSFSLMTISGRHTVVECSRYIQDNVPGNDKRKTSDVTKVTCKNCLQILKRKGML